MAKRIGYRMKAIAEYVSENEGCAILPAAMATRGSRREGHRHGYAATWRAVRAGLIEARRGKRRGTYALYAIKNA